MSKQGHTHAVFPATNWQWVLDAQSECGKSKQKALTLLCSGYWYPVYAFLRGKGHSPHDAEDLTQGFFQRMLEQDAFSRADPTKGRLRNYLVASLQNHVFAQHTSRMAQKRGQGALHLPIHLAWAESRWEAEDQEPFHNFTPEQQFNVRWWALITEQALGRIRDDYTARGEGEVFAKLAEHLDSGRAEPGVYKNLAADLRISEQSLRVGLFRLRRRVAEAIRSVLEETLVDPSAVEAELQEVLRSK